VLVQDIGMGVSRHRNRDVSGHRHGIRNLPAAGFEAAGCRNVAS
jgi:hypothetical protein